MPEPLLTTAHGTLYQGDCMDFLRSLDDGAADVVFADPPFNLDKNYGSGIKDRLPDDEYLDWCRTWVKECVRVVTPGGAIWLYNLPKWNIEVGHSLNEAGMTFRHWVAIDIKMLLPIPGRLYPSHYSLLYYTKGKPKTFVRPRVPIPVCRHCGGDIKDYGGHRKALNPEGLNVSDVWTDIPPVRHAKTKHRGANALSEKMLERVLTISSEEGDLVLDPFGGSGTTYAVAERMHRRWIGCELGDAEPIVARLTGGPKVEGIMPEKGACGKGVGFVTSATLDRLSP
ncbi:MAG TPA: site-specific DNA-methyltransferase [Acidimicrobiales bacterium]|nr:site-specific DNA-methyltransferase [Acidimicrobiales bacterium]